MALHVKSVTKGVHRMVVYPGLERLMRERGIRVTDVAETVQRSRSGMYSKLSGKCPLFIGEAIVIQKELFPDVSLDELFGDERR